MRLLCPSSPRKKRPLTALDCFQSHSEVLRFLVDFAEARKSHRRRFAKYFGLDKVLGRQVSSVLCILLKDSAWQAAAKDLRSQVKQSHSLEPFGLI